MCDTKKRKSVPSVDVVIGVYGWKSNRQLLTGPKAYIPGEDISTSRLFNSSITVLPSKIQSPLPA